MSTNTTRTAELVARVARWRRAKHPAAALEAQRALGEGATAQEALAAAGTHPGLVTIAAAAKPSDLDAFLETLAATLGRAEDRRRSLHGAAAYPAVLASAGFVLAVILAGGVRPAAGILEGLDAGAYRPPSFAPVLAVLALSGIALAYIALALRTDPPVPPFAGAKRRQERALILGAASVAAAHGATLPDAIAGAGALSLSPLLREEASALASAMRAGAKPATSSLLGELGTPIFAVASAGGEGAAALAALADAAEASAAADLPNLVLRAELLSLLIGAAAIATAGIAIYSTYTTSLHPF